MVKKNIQYSLFYNNPNTEVSIYELDIEAIEIKKIEPKRKVMYNEQGENLTFSLNVRKFYSVYHNDNFSYDITYVYLGVIGSNPKKSSTWGIVFRNDNDINWKRTRKNGTTEQTQDPRKYDP